MNEQQLYAMFLQWLPTAIPELKGATPEQVHGVVQKMAQSQEGKQKLAQLIQVMQKQLSTQSYQRGGTFNRFESRWNKHRDVSAEKFAPGAESIAGSLRNYGKQGRLVAKGMATEGFNATDFDPTREFDRKDFRARKQEARDMGITNRRQIKAWAASNKTATDDRTKEWKLQFGKSNTTLPITTAWQAPETAAYTPPTENKPVVKTVTSIAKPVGASSPSPKVSQWDQDKTNFIESRYSIDDTPTLKTTAEKLPSVAHSISSKYQEMREAVENGTLGLSFSSAAKMYTPPTKQQTAPIKPTIVASTSKDTAIRPPLQAAENKTNIPSFVSLSPANQSVAATSKPTASTNSPRVSQLEKARANFVTPKSTPLQSSAAKPTPAKTTTVDPNSWASIWARIKERWS